MAACNTPILFRECARKLPNQNGERLSGQDIFYLNHQVDVVGHDNKGRYRLKAAPFEVETFDNAFEGARYIVFDKAVRPYFGEWGKTLEPLKGHHVEVG